MGECNCEICLYSREYKKHIATVPEPARTFFSEMLERLWNVEFELDYHQAIADGSWPSAVPTLRNWLAKAIEAGTVETERLDAQHESAVATPFAHKEQ